MIITINSSRQVRGEEGGTSFCASACYADTLVHVSHAVAVKNFGLQGEVLDREV